MENAEAAAAEQSSIIEAVDHIEPKKAEELPPEAAPAAPAPAKSAKDGFQPIKPAVRAFQGAGRSVYKIYDKAHQFKEVEAETAVEAVKASGVEAPLRIVREVHGREVLVDLKRLLNKNTAA